LKGVVEIKASRAIGHADVAQILNGLVLFGVFGVFGGRFLETPAPG